MKKIIFTNGLIGGLIVTGLMFLTVPLSHSQKFFDFGEVMGYTSMIIALSSIFFGIRTYRNKYLGGTISFGRAFLVGLYIALVASAIYVIGWEIYLNTVGGNFMEDYTKCYLDKMRSNGASTLDIQKQTEKLGELAEYYKHPLIRWGMTFLEIFPVGLVVSLISAAILRRRQKAVA